MINKIKIKIKKLYLIFYFDIFIIFCEDIKKKKREGKKA